jgi:hypothetical protein
MNKLLFLFFTISKKLSLPDIGTLSFCTEEAKDDFANRTITPKLGKIVFTEENDKVAEESFSAFARTKLQISLQEIDRYFQSLVDELKNTNRLTLDGLGILTKKDHQLNFEPGFSTAPFFPPVDTKRVIRNANKDNDYHAQRRHRSYWWIYVLIVLIIAGAGYAFYYFYFAK